MSICNGAVSFIWIKMQSQLWHFWYQSLCSWCLENMTDTPPQSYDYIQTLEEEARHAVKSFSTSFTNSLPQVSLVWPSKFTFGKALYFLNRYSAFFDTALLTHSNFLSRRSTFRMANQMYSIHSRRKPFSVYNLKFLSFFQFWLPDHDCSSAEQASTFLRVGDFFLVTH